MLLKLYQYGVNFTPRMIYGQNYLGIERTLFANALLAFGDLVKVSMMPQYPALDVFGHGSRFWTTLAKEAF